MRNYNYKNQMSSGLVRVPVLLTVLAILFANNLFAQISGTIAIPSANYPTIKVAVDSLNLYGVAGGGGVTFNVAGGYTETFASTVVMTATGTSSDQIVFQKNGGGANPLITAPVGTVTLASTSTTLDGIWAFNGSDYVTVDGIDLIDNNTMPTGANSNWPNFMEYGYGFFRNVGGTDGCNNNTIKNCTVTLNRIVAISGPAYSGNNINGSQGILFMPTAIGNIAPASIIVPTSAAGTNSNNKIYSNTIKNCNQGICMYGYAASTPFTLGDANNDIGGNSLATGNFIYNFGGSTNNYFVASVSVAAGYTFITSAGNVYRVSAAGALGTTAPSSTTVNTAITSGTATVYFLYAPGPANGIIINNQWGSNVSYNTINSNFSSGGYPQIANGIRGILLGPATSASATVSNNSISLTSGSSAGAIEGIENQMGSTAASNAISINNNTITLNQGLALNTTAATFTVSPSGASYGVWNNGGTPATLNVNNNTFSSWTIAASSGTCYPINNAGAVSTALNMNSNNINGISFISTTSNSILFRGIYNSVASGTCALTINNNNIQSLSFTSVTGTGECDFVHSAVLSLSETIIGNTITNLTLNNTGITYLFNLSNATLNATVSNNSVVTQFTKNVSNSSNFFGIYNFGSPLATGTLTLSNNNFSNMTLNSSSGTTLGSSTGQYGIFWETNVATSPLVVTQNIINNTVSNVTENGTGMFHGIAVAYGNVNTVNNNTVTGLSGAGPIIGMFVGNSSTVLMDANNNTISNLSSSGASSAVHGMVIGGVNTSSGVLNLYSNVINNLSGSGATSPSINGINVSAAGFIYNIYKNKIYNLSESAAISTTAGAVNGILLAFGTTVSTYNNLIGGLTTPSANLTDAIRGISITSTTTSATYNVYYNTILISGTSSGTNFGSSGLFHTASATSTTALLNSRNNIIINNAVPNGTGLSVAFRRSTTALNNYSTSSNNNLFYAGVPSASKLIFYDGTNSDQTVMAYKIRVFPIDGNSGTENPTFLSTSGASANFLHIDPSVATNIESGAVNISGITDDYDAQTRQGNGGYVGTGTAPDIGGDEFGGIAAATLAAPINFTYNTATTSSFNITWDDNSVNEAGFVVYRSLNPGGPFNTIIAAVVSTSVGTTGTTYTLPQTGLLGNTTYYYQIVANNFSSSAPLSGSASTLPCGSGLAGTYLIPGAYPSISAAITALQTNGLSAPVILELDPSYVGAGETYPLTFGNTIGCLGSSNTLTLRPAATVVSPLTITSANTTATIDINGGNFVTIDGRPGGTGSNKYLIVENTSTTALSAGNAILIRNEASNNTVTYCEIRSANANIPTNTAITTAGSIPGAIAIGTTAGSFGNDNNTISFCDIHSLSSGGNLGACIYSGNSTTAGSLANNDNNIIDNNNIYDFFLATSASAGIDVSLGNNSWTITNNHVYQTGARNYAAGTQNVRGFWVTPNTGSLTSASGFTISGNYIGGNASNGTGTYTMTGTANYAFRGMDISVGTGAATSIQNNTMTNWNITGAYTGNSVYGIDVANGNVNIGTVTGNLVGSATTNGSITVTTTVSGGSMIGLRSGAGGTINFSNNTVGGIDMIGNATTIATGFNGIAGSGGANIIVNNNTVGSATLANSINMVSTSSTSTNAASVRGIINNSGTAGVVNTITNNLVANINSNNNATGSQASTLVGISVTLGTSTISGNTVRNLTTAGQTTAGAGTPAVIGIAYTSSTAPSLISNNTIHTLKSTHTSTTAAIQAAGIYFSGPSLGSHIIERNFIHSISIASPTNSAGFITGIDLGVVSGVTITVKNNMIRLGLDETGASVISPCTIRGITKNVPNSNIWFNSIYIGGTGVGTTATNTFCLARSSAATDDWRNNILVNNRSNATTGGKHYSINLSSTATFTLNYNDYYGNGAGYIFGFNGATDFASYATNWISGDANSYNLDPLFINPTGTSATVDLHIDPITPTIIEATGIAIGSVTNDFDNQTRASLTPTDMGADAGNFVNLLCNGQPPVAIAIITGNSSSICLSGSKTLTLTAFAQTPGFTYQWQESTTQGGPYTNVTGGSGGTTITFTTPIISQTMYYTCLITCSNGGLTTPSSEVAVVVNNPQIVSAPPVSRCGAGTVTLCATGSAGSTINWYTTPTGGTPITNPFSNVPVIGFNNDVVANGVGLSNTASTGTMPGVTYPSMGIDANVPTAYSFIDATYQWYSGSALPSCFLPTNRAIPSAQTPGLTYQLQSYSANNALTVASNTFAGSVHPTSGTLTLSTPASYSKLCVLYETVLNTAGPSITATVTFTDATTQVFSGNSVINWFTATSVAYTPFISRAGNTAPGAAGACNTGPYLFELPLVISPANYGKLVQSISFNWSAATGTTQQTVDYFHAMAVGGNVPGLAGCVTSPSISTTTTFYASASTGGGSSTNTGMNAALVTATSGAGTTNFGLVFDALSAFTLNSVTVYPVSSTSASGTVTVDVINSAGTVLNTITANVTGTPTGFTPVIINCNFNIAAGTNLKMRPGFTGISGLLFEPSASAPSGNYGYPYVIPGVLSINTSTLTAVPTNTARNDLYYYFYNWQVATGCESVRTSVVATVTPPPTLTVSPSQSVCNNVVATLAVTSNIPDYTSYIWSPITNLYLDPAATTTPYTGGSATTVYMRSTAAATTVYTCTATNSSAPFCGNTTTTTVAVQPNATATATAAPNPSCAGSPVTLTASLGTPTTVVLGIDNNATKIGGNNGNLYRSGTTTNTEMRTQYLLTQTELLAAGIQAGPIASIGFYVLTGGGSGVFSNFTLRMGHTTATALTATYQTGPFTDVWFASTFTPQAGLNTHVFTTPFVWNGIDNIVIESCNTLTTGASGTTLQTFTTPTETNMANLVAGGCSAAAGGSTGFTNCRPVISLYGNVSPTPSGFSWSDGSGIIGTTSPLVVSPSVNTSYTCTITANGCTFVSNPVNVVVNPLPSAPTASAPSIQCGLGIPTASVTSTSGAATPTFKWYSASTGGTLLQNSTSVTYTSMISTTTTFYVSEVNANGCESSPRTQVIANVTPTDPLTITGGVSSICLGTTLNFGSTQTGSNQNYTLTWTASPAVGSGLPAGPLGPVQNWYTNTFTSGTGTGVLSGNASLTGGNVQLTPNTTSQAGALTIPNPTNIAADALQVNFDLTLTQTGAEGADGLSYSFGDDVSATATVPNFENGTGTKLKVSFDSYGGAGAGQAGIYLMYNCNVANQTPTTSGVIAYIPNVSFVNTTTAVSITVTQAGLATVSLNGTPVISNIALPSGYLTSNRSTWQHVFKARTGAISQIHAIDNLVINYQNTVSTPVSGSTLSVTPTLAGTYTYTLTGIDGGCAYQTAQTVLVNPAAAAINAGPDLSTCSNTSVTLSASGSGLIPALRFTEVLWQVNAGTGPTGASIPAWTSAWYTANGGTTMDMIEITNLGSGLAGSEGITIEMWNAASTTSGLPAYIYTIPAGAPVMNSGGLLYFTHSGATVVTDFTNNFYARGGTSIDNGSGTAAGMIMRKGSVIIDAVAVSGYTFPAASGVTASDWSGTLASNSGLSGTVLVAADNNTASSWANTSASQLASIGTLNAGLVANLPSLGTVSWTSIPSGFTANSATATFGPLTTTTSFIVQFNNGTCSSYDTAIVNVFAVIPTPLIATNLDTICASGTATLTVTNSISTATYQWSSSPSGLPGTFTNISGATGTTYTTPGLTLGSSDTTLYYQVSGTCGSTPSTSATRIIYVSNPRVSAISNGTRCGLGTVNLAATPSAGASLNWYANATGGTSLGNGNTFITPVINATTNFYVSSSTLSTEIAGKPAPTSTENIVGNQPLGVSFNVISKPATIQTVKIYSVGAAPGSLYVELWNSAGTVLNTAGPFTYGAGSTANPTVVTLPLNFIVPVGTNYRLVTTQMSGGSLIRESAANNTFPYVSASGNISVTSGYILSSGTSATYYYLYNWQVQSLGCESARTAVVATVTAPPALTLSGAGTICQDKSQTLSVSSPNDPNYLYTWNPGGLVGSSVSVSPTSNTIYTVTASDNSGGANNGCVNVGTVAVNVNQAPQLPVISSTPAIPCGNAPVSLTATSTQPGVAQIGTGTGTNVTVGQSPYSGNWEGSKIQYLITQTELNTANIFAGQITSVAFNVTTVGVTYPMSAYTVKIGTTAATSLTAYETGLTQVYAAPGTIIPTLGWNTYNFSSPFNWNGVSNIVVEICHNNDPVGACASCWGGTATVQSTTTSTTSVYGQYADNTAPTNPWDLCSQISTGTISSSTNRPNMQVGYGASSTFLWSTGSTNANITVTPSAPTSYSVTVSNTLGCTRTSSITITPTAAPHPYLQEGDSVLCSNDQGFYMHVLDNNAYTGGYPAGTMFDFYGAGAILYQSSTDNFFFNANNSDAFYAVVTLPGYLGSCTAISDTSVMDFGNTQAPQYALSTDSVRCFGESNGKAIAAITFGGTPRFRWQWYNSAHSLVRDVTDVAFSDTLSGMPEGMYTFVLTDHQDSLTSPYCSITDSIFIGQPEAPLSVTENIGNHVNVLCNGALTGAIDIDVTGGTEPYSYNWSNSEVAEDLTGTGAGTYTCTVTDSRGCTTVITRTITEPTAIVIGATVNQIACNGGRGSVLLNVTGGVGPYSYEWSNGNLTSSNTNLLSGTYTVTVTDGNGCTKSGTYIINIEPTLLTASCSATPVNCFGGNNGTVGVAAGGGTPGYSYSWSNGSTSASQTSLIKGIYTVIVTDAHGCTASCSTSIAQPTQLAVTTVAVNPTSGSPASGTINVNVTGGTPAYNYLWNNGSTVQNRTGLSAGTYTVIVTDANGCSSSKVVTLTYTCQLGYVNTVVTKPSCGKANGVATVTGTGGTGYTYAWQTTPVQTTATATGLSYYFNSYVIITDVTTGCSFMDTVVLPTSNGLQLTLNSPAYAGGKNIRCNGETNGSISLTVSGSTGPYTYLWNTGATTQNLTGVGAGTYIVTVSNGGCTNSNLITLTQPTALVVSATKTDVSCQGGSNGTATASPSGGTAPYSYSWNSVPVKTSQTATGLAAGTYTVTVSDANGCTKTAVVTLTQPSTGVSVTSVVTNVNCNGGATGSIDITPSGGSAPYTYLWSTGATTQDRINVLAAGIYTVTVTDNKGCSAQHSKTITQPTAITATSSVTNVSCNGGTNGTGSVTASGGTPPYTYSWNSVPAKTGASVTGLKKGTYTVLITDSKGCVKAITVNITEPAAISIAISKTNVTTAGGSNGTATANVSGGVPPYSYSWNTVPVKSTQTATGLIAGTYTVTVTDANSCTKTASVVITQPSARMAGTSNNGASNAVVFPNPSTGKFTVSFDETIRTEVNLEVMSMTGERVFMKDFDVSEQSNSFNVDLGTLPKGIYFIRYRTNEKDWIDKLVIR